MSARRQTSLHRPAGQPRRQPQQHQHQQQYHQGHQQQQQHHQPPQQPQGGFAPVGTGTTSFAAVLQSFERSFSSVARDPNPAARKGELLQALDAVFTVTTRARASREECKPVDKLVTQTLIEGLLLRKFSLNRQLEELQLDVLDYLFALEQQHLRATAACVVRERLLRAVGRQPDSAACVRCMQCAVDAIVRTCDNYGDESIELCRLVERTPAKRVFRDLLLDSVVEMLRPNDDLGATQSAVSIILTLCSSAAAPDPGGGGDSLVTDALAVVESLTLSLARDQYESMACCNKYMTEPTTAASLKAIEQLLQSLGKLAQPAGRIMIDRALIGRAMAI